MDNYQIPSAQPQVNQPAIGPRPMVQQVQVVPKSKNNIDLIKTIVIVILSLMTVTFLGLFIWMLVQYNDASSDVDGQIAVAVAAAKDEQAKKLEAEFQAREKNPYKPFAGPADYGALGFNYPKTWSVYIAADASNGGDFEAYFNPNEVEPVAKNTVNALRLTIRDKDFDAVAQEYQKVMDRKDSNLTMQAVTINDFTANRYTGTIPGTDLNGIIVIFKIRDKTAVFRTDSTLFQGDFDTLLQTITFNA
ncbi:hypothetical protein IJH26_01970 [Candidatus Saccharibacteria bacterium]|nr:hypothetical protein [Candidatus Saccharibacteria bacterium]MBQ3476256.1 hypothetical protein [Candidatus Saccharibacteria bacterium]